VASRALGHAAGDDRDGTSIADPFAPGRRGAILVPTVDNTLFAFDRDSGQMLWQRSFGEHEVEVQPVPGAPSCGRGRRLVTVRHAFVGGVVVMRKYDGIEVFSPQNGQMIAAVA
jgi:hypothetical protein